MYGEKLTFFCNRPDEVLKNSAEEDGDSSGVSIRGRLATLIIKSLELSPEGRARFSLGGVGGRATSGTSPAAEPVIMSKGRGKFHWMA